MILMSPSKDVDQATPVTTTYDVPDHVSIDWDRFEKLCALSIRRARHQLGEAQSGGGGAPAREFLRELRVLETLYAQALEHQGIVAACAVIYMRAKAIHDPHDPDLLAERTVPTPRVRQLTGS